jgi:hypothetical protein
VATIAQRRRGQAVAAKNKRKKIFAILGLCALVVLLAIQLPKTLDLLSSDTPAAGPVAAPDVQTTPTRSDLSPLARRLLRRPASTDPFLARSVGNGDPVPSEVSGPGGARDPFIPVSAAEVLAPKRIVVGTPTSGATPTVGYIVVLASIRTTAGRAVAERIASKARRDNLGKVGVLDSSTRRPLRAGYYVAYIGPFRSASAVQDAANHAHALGYRTAYIRELVKY